MFLILDTFKHTGKSVKKHTPAELSPCGGMQTFTAATAAYATSHGIGSAPDVAAGA